MDFDVGQVFAGEYPTSVAEWCVAHGDRWVEEIESTGDVRRFQIVKVPELTEEELEKKALEAAKAERAQAVAAIVVEVDGMVFDGDETSQARMSRALEVARITGMNSTVWVLADNTVAEVTVTQMEQALSAAMLKMAELWTKPYEASAE